MSAVGILICFILVFVLSLILGVTMHDNNTDFLKSLLLGFIITIIILVPIYIDVQNDKLEKYGTYPDTTITIKNGVKDTSITYKVYEEKNN